MVVWEGAVLLSHELLGQMEELRVTKDTHFKGLIQLAKTTIQLVEVSLSYTWYVHRTCFCQMVL